MAQISSEDRDLIKALRLALVLQNVESNRLNQMEGIILVCCADGDQMPDIWEFQSGLMVQQGQRPRIHILSLNGGALLIPETSPLNRELHEDWVYIKHLKDAHQLKQTRTIVLYAHAPCGAASLARLTLIEVITLLKKAGEKVREHFPAPAFQVVCFFHVDNGESKRTYFVSGPNWKRWLASK